MQAAYDGDLLQLETLLDASADVLATDHQGLTALFYAVLSDHHDIVTTLLEHGQRDLAMMAAPNNVTCLYIAAQNGSIRTVRQLADVGGPDLLHMATDGGATCLYIASQQGFADIVQDLIARSPDLLRMVARNGFSCLHVACQHGHLAVAEALAQAGGASLLHLPARTGLTCLHVACEHGCADVAEMLVWAGGPALARLRAEDGSSALLCACREGHAAAAGAVLRAGDEALLCGRELQNDEQVDGALVRRSGYVGVVGALLESGHLNVAKALVEGEREAGLAGLRRAWRGQLAGACRRGQAGLALALLGGRCQKGGGPGESA